MLQRLVETSPLPRDTASLYESALYGALPGEVAKACIAVLARFMALRAHTGQRVHLCAFAAEITAHPHGVFEAALAELAGGRLCDSTGDGWVWLTWIGLERAEANRLWRLDRTVLSKGA